MSFKSLPIGFGLFVIGILAFNAYSEMAAAANAYCNAGEIEFTFGVTPGCDTPLVGCTDKCTFWCSAKGLPTRTICTGQGGIFVQYACVCCCGTTTPVPVPSPPPPPPPRNPNDLCLPSETSFTSTPPSGICTNPPNCPPCTCPSGAQPTENSCTLNLCQCCCA